MDNFSDFFNIEKADLLEAKNEAEVMSQGGCSTDEAAKEGARCDTLLWLPSPYVATGNGNPSLRKIQKTMKEFTDILSIFSQSESGEKSLKVNVEETQISRYNGATNQNQKYYRHKDSYKRDENNKLDGASLRKLTMVIFLNDNIDEV